MNPEPSQPSFYSRPMVIGLGYLWVIWWFVLPSNFDITTDLIGFWGSDQMDTITLHWSVFNNASHFYPEGYDFWRLTPNVVDHLTFWPLQQILPFPLNLNLWWVGVIWLGVLSIHWMILQRDGKHDTAWLAGVLYLMGEPLLREVNWGHAPQSLWFPAFLSLGYWFKWKHSQRRIDLGISILFGGLLGWCYLFYAPFLMLLMIPTLLRTSWKYSTLWLGGIVLLLLPNLYWVWMVSPEMTTIPNPPLIQGQTLLEMHSNDWLWWWNSTPIDVANQISVVALVGLGWILFRVKNHTTTLTLGGWGLLLGGLLLMGTTTPLFEWMQTVSFMNRLQWPERFGIVALTGTVLLISALPKPIWFIPLILIEMPLRSENIPLHTVSMEPYECYRGLSQIDGAILSLPIKEGPDLYNIHGIFQQIHQRQLVNPFILPPFVSPPYHWEQQRTKSWMLQIDGEIPLSTLTIKDLSDRGITSVIVDKQWVPKNQQGKIIERLSAVLGEPQDLGCLYHWSSNHSMITLEKNANTLRRGRPAVDAIQVPLQ